MAGVYLKFMDVILAVKGADAAEFSAAADCQEVFEKFHAAFGQD